MRLFEKIVSLQKYWRQKLSSILELQIAKKDSLPNNNNFWQILSFYEIIKKIYLILGILQIRIPTEDY